MLLSAKVAAIEFSGDTARLAVIKTGGRNPSILELHARTAEYEEPEQRFEAMVRAVDEVLAEIKNRPAACVLCVSSLYSIVRTLTIPFRGRRRVAAAVPFELEPFLAFPLEELLVDFKVVAEVDGETEVLAIGMRRSQLEEQVAILSEAGVEVEAVNLDAIGLTGLWHARQKGLKGLKAVLHVREESASLAITHNKTLAYFRPLMFGEAQVREQPAAVGREVQNTLRAFLAKWHGDGEFDAVHVTGLDFSDEEREALSEALRMPVTDQVLLGTLRGAEAAGEAGALAPNAWEAVVGVAMGAEGGSFALDFKRHEHDWRASSRGVVTHLMFSACLALLVLIGVAFYYHQGAVSMRVEAAILEQQMDALQQELESLYDQGLPDINFEYFMEPPLLDVLAEIAQKMPDTKVNITRIDVRSPVFQRYWISIQGTANNAGAVTEVYNDLRNSELFSVRDDAIINVVDAQTRFTIQLQRPDQGDGA